MNLSSNEPLTWDSNDASLLKAFLNTDVAKKAFAIVMDSCPVLLDGGDVNKTLVRSGEVKGFSLALNTLFELVVKKPEITQSPTAYPDLDDESKWRDTTTKA